MNNWQHLDVNCCGRNKIIYKMAWKLYNMLNDITACKLNNALLRQRFTTLNIIFTVCRKIKCYFTAIYKIEQIAILNAIFTACNVSTRSHKCILIARVYALNWCTVCTQKLTWREYYTQWVGLVLGVSYARENCVLYARQTRLNHTSKSIFAH